MLVNIKRKYILDSVQKQQVSQQVAALYGSLSLMYARHVQLGLKDPSTLTEAYRTQVDAILSYVEEMGYQDILQ